MRKPASAKAPARPRHAQARVRTAQRRCAPGGAVSSVFLLYFLGSCKLACFGGPRCRRRPWAWGQTRWGRPVSAGPGAPPPAARVRRGVSGTHPTGCPRRRHGSRSLARCCGRGSLKSGRRLPRIEALLTLPSQTSDAVLPAAVPASLMRGPDMRFPSQGRPCPAAGGVTLCSGGGDSASGGTRMGAAGAAGGALPEFRIIFVLLNCIAEGASAPRRA